MLAIINPFYKLLLSAATILLISEIAKRSSLLGAVIASLPMTSVIALTWLYLDTKDTQKVIALSSNIFWLVLPSMVCFFLLPFLLKKGMNFYWSLGIAMATTIGCYGVVVGLLRYFKS